MKKSIFAAALIIVPVLCFGFNTPVFYDSGSFPRGLTAADINADGIVEAVAANFGADTLIGKDNASASSTSVAVFKKNSAGLSGSIEAFAGSIRGLASGELSGDSIADIAATNYADGTVMIFTSSKSGLSAPVTVAVGKYPVGIAVGDCDNDGVNEIAAAVYGENKIAILDKTEKGTYAVLYAQAGTNPTDVTVGTYEGKQVILTANYGAGSVSVITYADGAYSQAAEIKTGGGTCKVEAADINKDGLSEIIAANFYDNTVSVISAAATQTLKLKGLRPNGLAVGDINADGYADIVTADRDSDSVEIIMNNAGIFGDSENITVTDSKDLNYGPVETVIADVNADGASDIVFTHMRTGKLGVLLGDAKPVISKPEGAEPMTQTNVYNYPNPASTSTVIRFPLEAPADVVITVVDINNVKVWEKSLSKSETHAGVNNVTWDLNNGAGQNVGNGAYMLKVISGTKVITKTIAVVK